jgi:hypothetical protein
MMPTILTHGIEFLGILIHCVSTLLQCKQLFHLCVHETLMNMMFLKGPLEFCPCDLMSLWNHGLVMFPPQQHCTAEL